MRVTGVVNTETVTFVTDGGKWSAPDFELNIHVTEQICTFLEK